MSCPVSASSTFDRRRWLNTVDWVSPAAQVECLTSERFQLTIMVK